MKFAFRAGVALAGLVLAAAPAAAKEYQVKMLNKGSDGSTPNVRASRYGDWTNNIGENIVYQAMTSARDSVIGLIIDDGIATRGHRKNIFDPTYRAAGIALGERWGAEPEERWGRLRRGAGRHS